MWPGSRNAGKAGHPSPRRRQETISGEPWGTLVTGPALVRSLALSRHGLSATDMLVIAKAVVDYSLMSERYMSHNICQKCWLGI